MNSAPGYSSVFGLVLSALVLVTSFPLEAQNRDEFEQAQAIAKRKRAGENLSRAELELMGKFVERGWISDMDPERLVEEKE